MHWSTEIRIAIVATLFVLLLPFGVPTASRIAAAQEITVGVVNKTQVASASKAWKTFKKQFDVEVKRWQKKVRESEALIAKQGQSLLASKDSLSPSELRDKQLALQKLQRQLSEELGKRKRALDQRVLNAEKFLNKAINDATTAVGRKRGLSLVLNAAMVVHNDKSFDITKEVARQVNKDLKQLPKR